MPYWNGGSSNWTTSLALLCSSSRERGGEAEEKKNEGVSRRRGDKKLGQVRQVTAPAVPEGSPVANAFCYPRYVDGINTRRVIFLLLRFKEKKTPKWSRGGFCRNEKIVASVSSTRPTCTKCLSRAVINSFPRWRGRCLVALSATPFIALFSLHVHVCHVISCFGMNANFNSVHEKRAESQPKRRF